MLLIPKIILTFIEKSYIQEIIATQNVYHQMMRSIKIFCLSNNKKVKLNIHIKFFVFITYLSFLRILFLI